jgi:hypothetical protein
MGAKRISLGDALDAAYRTTTPRPERVDLDAVEAPTDSESGDAQYNPDVWELRARITVLVAELRAAREVIGEAVSVAAFLPLEVIRKLDAYHAACDRRDPPAGGD